MDRPENFQKIISHILSNEGGYSNRDNDLGGETKYGITHLTFRKAKKFEIIDKDLDLKNLTIDLAKTIYYELYWKKSSVELLHDLLFQYLYFDSCVNHGIRQANKFLQKSIEKSQHNYIIENNIKFPIDSIVGQKTNTFYHYAVVDYKSELPLYYIFLSFRYEFYGLIIKHRKSQIVNIKGWLNRLQQFTERKEF